MRPKLLRPLDFPGKSNSGKSTENKAAKETLEAETEALPIRAMVARYIAVVMLDKKTTT